MEVDKAYFKSLILQVLNNEDLVPEIADTFASKFTSTRKHIGEDLVTKIFEKDDFKTLNNIIYKLRTDHPIVKNGYTIPSTLEVYNDLETLVYRHFDRTTEEEFFNLISELRKEVSINEGDELSKFVDFISTTYRLVKYSISDIINEYENGKKEELRELIVRSLEKTLLDKATTLFQKNIIGGYYYDRS